MALSGKKYTTSTLSNTTPHNLTHCTCGWNEVEFLSFRYLFTLNLFIITEKEPAFRLFDWYDWCKWILCERLSCFVATVFLSVTDQQPWSICITKAVLFSTKFWKIWDLFCPPWLWRGTKRYFILFSFIGFEATRIKKFFEGEKITLLWF